MKSVAAGAIIAFAIGFGATSAKAAEIRLAEQFSMGYLQFNVMKRDRLIEKYAGQRGLKDFKVSWQRFNGPAAMNEALLSGSTDIVAGGVPGLITLWDKTIGTSFEVKGICALSSQPFLLNTSNPEIKSIKDFSDRDRIALPSIKVSVQAVVLQMAVAAAFGEENYAKLDSLTVSMSPPDSTIALLTGSGNINTVFSVPPFQFQQLAQANIHTVLSSFDVLGPHSFTVAWTSARFRKDNPELYAAFRGRHEGGNRNRFGESETDRANLDRRHQLEAFGGDGDESPDRSRCHLDHDAGRDHEIREIHAQGRQHQARTGIVAGHVLSGDRRVEGELEFVIPGRAKREPGIHNHERGYDSGHAKGRARNDD